MKTKSIYFCGLFLIAGCFLLVSNFFGTGLFLLITAAVIALQDD